MKEVYEYKIEISDDSKKDYLSLLRYLIFYSQQYWAPYKVTYGTEFLSIEDGEVFANRLGLLTFKSKKPSPEPVGRFELENTTNEIKNVYSGDLVNSDFECTHKNELILKLPPFFKRSSLTIDFEKGRGTEHARFSRIEGYRMNTKDKLQVFFELNTLRFDPIWENLKNILDQELLSLTT